MHSIAMTTAAASPPRRFTAEKHGLPSREKCISHLAYLALLVTGCGLAFAQNLATGVVEVPKGHPLAGDLEVAAFVPAPLAVRISPAGTGFRPAAQERIRVGQSGGPFSLAFPSVRVRYLRAFSDSSYPVEIPALPVRGTIDLPALSPIPFRHVSLRFDESWPVGGEAMAIATALPKESGESCSPRWAPVPYFESFEIAPTVSIERAPVGQELWLFHAATGARRLDPEEMPFSPPARASVVSRTFQLISPESAESPIALVTWSAERIPILVVGASGAFEIRAPAGHWEIGVRTFEGNQTEWAQEVDATESRPIQLELPLRADLRGKVLLPSGEAVPRALVWRAGEARWQATTAEDGTFRLRDLPSGANLVLCVQDPSGNIHPREFPALPAGRSVVELTIPFSARATPPPAAVISGRVVDEAGRPAPGIRLELVQESTKRRLVERLVDRSPERATAVAESDILGVFELSGVLRPGQYRIVAHGSGFSPFATEPIDIFAADDRFDVGDLKLSRGLTLEGEVVAPSGEGVAGASVSVAIGVDGLRLQLGGETIANDLGEFSIGNVPSGAMLEIRARSTTGAGTSMRLADSDDLGRIRLVIGPAVDLDVVVRDSQNLPIAAADVMVRTIRTSEQERAKGPRAWHARTDENGVARVAGVDCAPLMVSASAEGYSRAATQVSLDSCPDPEPLAVAVQLQPRIRIVGRVIDANGMPVGDAVVAVDGHSITTDALGNYSLRAPAGGLVRIKYGNDRRGWATLELSVGMQDAQHDLVLP